MKFNPKSEAVSTFDLLPPGRYRLLVEGAVERENASGTGKHIYVPLVVIGGDLNGRKLHQRFNIVNNSEKAQQIGRGQFGAFILACGYGDGDFDTDTQLPQLQNKVVQADVVHRPDRNGEMREEVKKFLVDVSQAAKPIGKVAVKPKPGAKGEAKDDETFEVPF